MPVRVAIFDDKKPVREAISLLIDGTEGLEFAGAYADCTNLVAHLKAARPDVILMDIEMPGMDGLEAVKVIKQEFPEMIVLMQTVFEDDDKVFDAICNGASGYLLKKTPPAKLMDSIVEAYQGGAPMSPAVAKKTLQLFQRYFTPNTDYNLTSREKEVLQSMTRCHSYKMIADNLSISYDTVRSHVRNIYEKLHVACMSEAVAKALKERLV